MKTVWHEMEEIPKFPCKIIYSPHNFYVCQHDLNEYGLDRDNHWLFKNAIGGKWAYLNELLNL